jgi:hypothetical protein
VARLEAKPDAHHKRMMARLDSQLDKKGGMSRKDGGHRFGGKSRRN